MPKHIHNYKKLKKYRHLRYFCRLQCNSAERSEYLAYEIKMTVSMETVENYYKIFCQWSTGHLVDISTKFR